MSVVVKPSTFSAGATIIAAEHNSNFDTLYADYNGNITNSNVAASAAIAYSKLNLATSIVNADVATNAAIVASKLVLTSPGPIGSVASNTGAFTSCFIATLTSGTSSQGSILYDNGTSIVKLVGGTAGWLLTTQGQAANPNWTAPLLYSAGTLSEVNASTERTHSGDTNLTKMKEISPLPRSGTVSTSYDMNNVASSNGQAQLYINDIAVGTLNTNSSNTYVTYTDTGITAVYGDKFQVYAKTVGGDTVKVKNFKILVTNPSQPQELSGL